MNAKINQKKKENEALSALNYFLRKFMNSCIIVINLIKIL